ncbi:MAG TPA: alpha/beta fold hydrolase [Leptolyngbyaceae cyanobacterium M33_DOE_097]|uniref:Alpha/beta fold hydrolase n=1 Tax=Oscillatoriales cyanobacterium SpSt-418 TaxID=2282169 RepID=A0A7C3PED7_9CYAN|nr:alpha/beta fold hydrolase [Leptolyngbyaceae cyanobacterium M33_DOE_097]
MAQAVSLSPSDIGDYWEWQGHRIHFIKAGKSNTQHPPLLLVHGFGASTDHWRKNIQGLKTDFEVWAVDLLGFGRSAKPELQYSGLLWRDQLHHFIRDVIGRPAVLAGNSLGGYTSLCAAADHPESAAGLVLINSAGPFSDAQPVMKSPAWREMLGKVTQDLFQQDLVSFFVFQYVRQKSVIRKTLERVYLDHSAITDQLIEDIYRPSCDEGALKVFSSVFRTPQGERVDALLQRMKCPLLLLWGEADPWMNSRERSAKFHEHYEDLTEFFLRAGHCPHDEVPDQVNHLIRDWMLSRVSHS